MSTQKVNGKPPLESAVVNAASDSGLPDQTVADNSTTDKGVLSGGAGRSTLRLAEIYRGKALVVVGGTGFLGKVFWAMLLDRLPELGHIYLLVRPKGTMDAEARFWKEIASNELMRPLRERYGEGYEAFLREKVTPVAGDIGQLCCGISAPIRNQLRGNVAAVVNAAGVVEFDPPLDVALEVNAFGVQNIVTLARDLGNCPVFHTSTCFVAGSRTGFVSEQNPLDFPFPRADELDTAHWDADREISECLDVIRQAKQRADDAFRQSHFLDEAKRNLEERGAPPYGAALQDEIQRVRRKYVEARLAEMGKERAQFWGWANTYTYTKSLGEQIVARSGLPFTIGRPAIIESTVSFPFPSWNEGINTSAPLIYALRSGQPQLPGSDNHLDIIPCDMVATGMILSIAELLEGTAPAVYQYGSSDTNPVTMARIFELSGLYKRKYYQRTARGGAVVSFLQAHYEGSLLSTANFERIGPHAFAKASTAAADVATRLSRGPVKSLLSPLAKNLRSFARNQEKVGNILSCFAPFTAEYHYTFRCDHTRAAFARLSAAEAATMIWEPENIDWRKWFLEVHMPALETWVFPELERKLKKRVVAPPRHETLVSLLDDAARRRNLEIGLALSTPNGMLRTSYAEWRRAAQGVAGALRQSGVQHGDRVALCASNHPNWVIAFFGILYAGGTVVPLDSQVTASPCDAVLQASRAKVLLLDDAVANRLSGALAARVALLTLNEVCQAAPAAHGSDSLAEADAIKPEDVAALIYTSGTTDRPKGVMLSHYNLTSLVASLAPLFPLKASDRLLSVLPLHHTFELTCGLLLPLAQGARVVYLDQVNRERLSAGLSEANVTAMVGVPALWESLERQIHSRIKERGPVAGRLFEFALTVSRALGDHLGVDAGRLLFGPVHASLGGNLRLLVSGGAALPESTHRLFGSLGLHLAEGYGLTEASPVVSVAKAGPGAKAGHVGEAIPGVDIRIDNPDKDGVGEIVVRGPNVMLGYADDEEATRQVLGEDGWLKTGDLGRVDRKGRLVIVGREKDVIVPSSGENVYPDDVEAKLAGVPHVAELCVLGIRNAQGKEVVALVAVAEEGANPELVKSDLSAACAELPSHMKPAVVRMLSVALPRTATRKVKRREVQRVLERMLQAEQVSKPSVGVGHPVDQAVAVAVGSICRRPPSGLRASQSLRGDLGFDSLMLLELLVSLETQLSASVDSERLESCETLGDVQALAREAGARTAHPVQVTAPAEEEPPIRFPAAFNAAAMHWMSQAQAGFYRSVMRTKVSGRSFIPQNRSTLVIANHASHLDMGLVKYALGSYGKNMSALAAQDYFFESGRIRKAYFENLTNLIPLSRTGSLRQSLRQAGEHLESGKVILLFPEGTRSPSGELQEFKPLAAHLALNHNIDVLPMWLGGTFAALPKGATTIRSRDLQVRIGPVLTVSELKRLSAGLSNVERTRAVTRLMQRAIEELSRGNRLEPASLTPEQVKGLSGSAPGEADTLSGVFSELPARFVAGVVSSPVTYYFSLGSERWTVRVNQDSCRVLPGKAVDVADCVLKTSPKMFTRIVRDAYSPSPGEFVSGQVKSNNIPLLMTFQKAFQLVPEGQRP